MSMLAWITLPHSSISTNTPRLAGGMAYVVFEQLSVPRLPAGGCCLPPPQAPPHLHAVVVAVLFGSAWPRRAARMLKHCAPYCLSSQSMGSCASVWVGGWTDLLLTRQGRH